MMPWESIGTIAAVIITMLAALLSINSRFSSLETKVNLMFERFKLDIYNTPGRGPTVREVRELLKARPPDED